MGISQATSNTAVFCVCGTVVIENRTTYKTNGCLEILNLVREMPPNDPLVNLNDSVLPPLHIKLEFMKNFVKSMNKEGETAKAQIEIPEIE